MTPDCVGYALHTDGTKELWPTKTLVSFVTVSSGSYLYILNEGEMVMISTTSELQDICTKLDEVLSRPQVFGLGKTIPQPLAARLQEIRQMLEQVSQQRPDEMTSDDLEAELSQDSDCVA